MPETATPTSSGTTSSTSAPASTGASSTSAPASTPAAASSVPASAPASAEASLERASAALESASSADNPATQATPPGAATPAETAAAATTGPQFHLPKTKEDYDRILENAREKVRQELMEKFGWVDQLKLDKGTIEEALGIINMMQNDREGFLREYMAGNEEDEELVDPEPDFTGPDGKSKFYSDTTMKALLTNLEKRLMRQMKPALTAVEKQQQAEQAAAVKEEGRRIAEEALTAIRKYPHYEELKEKIGQKLAALDPTVRRRMGSIAALHMAYQAAVQEHQPTIAAKTEEQVRKQFTKQAATSTGHVQPNSQQAARPRIKDGDVDGIAKRMEELAAAQ